MLKTKSFILMMILFITSYGLVFSQTKGKHNRAEAMEFTKKGLELNNNSKAEINLYQKAIDADATYAPAYYNMGNVYFDLENYEKAIFFYKTACELKPSDRDYWYNLAFSYFKKREYIQSIESINYIIRMDKDRKDRDLEAVYLLAKIYTRTQSQTTLNAARKMLIDILKETSDRDLHERAVRLLNWLNDKLKIK